jgi:subtilisin family serine protease
MDVADAHLASRGDGVRIAIIDTGVDILHPDLAGVIEETRNFVDADAERFRRDRHGTELAGIIAAVANNRQGIVGVAPGSRLHVYKACWQLRDTEDAARCNSFTLARALTAAIDARVQVVNLSLAGPADPLLRGLIEVGRRRGILFVVAASLGETSPEAFGPEGVIAVTNGGALGEPGSPLRAPGREILTLLPGGHYDFASGVSLATAQVTGTVALMLARNPHLTAVSAYQTLRSTSVRVVMEDPTAGVDDTINACAAVAAITGHGSCRENPSSHRVAMH